MIRPFRANFSSAASNTGPVTLSEELRPEIISSNQYISKHND
jgi:hypothetical protein